MGVALRKISRLGRRTKRASALRPADPLPHVPRTDVHAKRVGVDAEENGLINHRRDRHGVRQLGTNSHAGFAPLRKREGAETSVLRAGDRQTRRLRFCPRGGGWHPQTPNVP